MKRGFSSLLLAAGASLILWALLPSSLPLFPRLVFWALLGLAACFGLSRLPGRAPAPLPVPTASDSLGRAEKQLLSSAADSVEDGLLVVDQRQKVLFCNEAVAVLLNRPSRDAVGLPLWEVFRQREVSDMVDRVLAEGHPVSREIIVPLPSETVWEVWVRPFPRQGNTEGAVITFRDVSDLRRLENNRREFVANVSHELRTPLTALRAALETLLEGAMDDKKHARDFLQTAHDQVERLQRLIDDLLALSRLDKASKDSPRMASAEIQAAASKVLKTLAPMARRAKVTLETDWPKSVVRVALSEDELSQVFMNLLDNAIKFNRPQGRVVLSVKPAADRAEFSVKLSGDFAELSVQDTGVGIPEEHLSRIFERFYRVDKARNREAGGTGLGLSIVKHIVENAGGAIRAESPPAGGARFLLTLPLAKL